MEKNTTIIHVARIRKKYKSSSYPENSMEYCVCLSRYNELAPIMTEQELISLNENGWTEFESGSSDNELISIASKIGKVLNHPNGESVFILKPKPKNEAGSGTFSDKHGLDNFPFHTDTAFLKKPARFILMHLSEPSVCNTTLILKNDVWNLLEKKDKINAERSVYLVKTKKERFYTSFVFRENNVEGIKYDPACMYPFNNSAKEFEQTFQEILKIIEPKKVKWNGNKTVIIDNWKCLHGRGSAKNDKKRELKRIYIN